MLNSRWYNAALPNKTVNRLKKVSVCFSICKKGSYVILTYSSNWIDKDKKKTLFRQMAQLGEQEMWSAAACWKRNAFLHRNISHLGISCGRAVIQTTAPFLYHSISGEEAFLLFIVKWPCRGCLKNFTIQLTDWMGRRCSHRGKMKTYILMSHRYTTLRDK